MPATMRFMNMTLAPTRVTTRAITLVLAATALALVLALLPTAPALAGPAEAGEADRALVIAAEGHERRPIAPTQRDQLGLLLYAFMAVATVVGIATMRRQLKGERPQTDGEFRWR